MAIKPTIYMHHDSVSHRMARLVHDHPRKRFTTAQLLAASMNAVREGEPTLIPAEDLTVRAAPRSATAQIRALLYKGILKRVADGQWLYSAGPTTLDKVHITRSSFHRPKDVT